MCETDNLQARQKSILTVRKLCNLPQAKTKADVKNVFFLHSISLVIKEKQIRNEKTNNKKRIIFAMKKSVEKNKKVEFSV